MLQTHMDHQGHCKVAVGQMTSTSDRDANFLTCKRLAQACSDQICADYVDALRGISASAAVQLPMWLQPTCARHTSVLQRCVLCTSVFVQLASLFLSLSRITCSLSETPTILTGYVHGYRLLLLSSVPCCSCQNASASLAEAPLK